MRVVALRTRSAALPVILARAWVRVWLHNILHLICNTILQLKYILIFTFFVPIFKSSSLMASEMNRKRWATY